MLPHIDRIASLWDAMEGMRGGATGGQQGAAAESRKQLAVHCVAEPLGGSRELQWAVISREWLAVCCVVVKCRRKAPPLR